MVVFADYCDLLRGPSHVEAPSRARTATSNAVAWTYFVAVGRRAFNQGEKFTIVFTQIRQAHGAA